jgi:hypothetical protein
MKKAEEEATDEEKTKIKLVIVASLELKLFQMA